MRFMLILYFLAVSIYASATDYYISAAGDDNANGLTQLTAWKTISKINSVFSTLKPGDRILFRKNDTFYGTLKISASGTSVNPLTISSYGSGTNPVLTGLTTISGWTDETGGVFSAPVSSEDLTNMVIINGTQYGMGRYPRDSYLTLESHYSNISITDNSLTGSPDWTGAEIVINKNGWSMDRCLVTKHSSSTLTYTNLGSLEEPTDGRNYFFQNHRSCLTAFGDWYHDKTANRLYVYFGNTNPTSAVTQMATLKNIIFNPFYTNVILDGLSIKGSISSAVLFQSTCDYSQIRNCNVSHAGNCGISYHGNYGTIDNNKVFNCVSAGINEDYGSHIVISNNTVQNIGLIKGSAFRATYSVGIKFEDTYGALVQYNTIQNTAYNGISISNHSAPHSVKNNFISYCCPWHELDDGGGIYTYNYTANIIRTIEGNIILYVGDDSGVNNSSGIYLDEVSKYVIVRNNTVAHCGIGIHLHKGSVNTIDGNNTYDNYTQIQFSNWTYTPLIHDNKLTGNIFLAKSDKQRTLAFYTTYNEIPLFGTASGNYYARPMSDNTDFFIYPSISETLSQWKQRVAPQDASSMKSNVTISDTTGFFRFCYNPSKTGKVFQLDKPMIDIKGIKFTGSITLLPYSSALLMTDPSPAPPIILSTDVPVAGNISIYPNPTRDFIYFSNTDVSPEPVNIKVFDLSGKLCMDKMLEPFNSTVYITLNLKSGVYLVVVTSGKVKLYTGKLIIKE